MTRTLLKALEIEDVSLREGVVELDLSGKVNPNSYVEGVMDALISQGYEIFDSKIEGQIVHYHIRRQD